MYDVYSAAMADEFSKIKEAASAKAEAVKKTFEKGLKKMKFVKKPQGEWEPIGHETGTALNLITRKQRQMEAARAPFVDIESLAGDGPIRYL